eukprot:TRINITY_DN3157_c2_g1_i1.p1 TRINITY_DN3157_c2_g1~~TRINITY_DN3157_c2_g1_i1.p1  ORF type:complete len:457 (+),score=84.29 TRINITY_DN3157_c2_g1_i1:34-1404(+)
MSKVEREQWVTGHTGSSISHVLLLSSAFCLTPIIRDLFNPSPGITSIILEFVTYLFMFLLICFDHLVLVMIIIIFCLLYTIFTKPRRFVPYQESKRLPAMTFSKYAVLMPTLVAIFAVDYPPFPRNLCKTEAYGISLMDAGVGGFAFLNGAVAQLKNAPTKAWMARFRQILVVIVGIGRLVLTRLVGYQEHVSEYGRDWNFFITLGIMQICSSFFPDDKDLLIGSLSTTLNTLLFFALGWVRDMTTRDNFFTANKEGLISLPGYICLFFFSKVVMKHLADIERHINVLDIKERLKHFLRAVLMTVFLLSSSKFCNLFMPTSRAYCNLPYILWVLAFLSFCNTLFLLVRYFFCIPVVDSELVRALGANQLLVFLAANIYVGLFNILTDTIHSSTLKSWISVSFYLVLMCWVSLFLFDKYNGSAKRKKDKGMTVSNSEIFDVNKNDIATVSQIAEINI